MFSIAYGDQPKRGWVRKGSKFSALWDGFCTRRLVDFTLRIGRENTWIHPDRRPALPDRRDLAPIVPNVSLSRGSSFRVRLPQRFCGRSPANPAPTITILFIYASLNGSRWTLLELPFD